jgi:hypothetical protein
VQHSWYSFISCVEQQPAESRLDLWPQCGVALGLDVIGIQNCADGEEGEKVRLTLLDILKDPFLEPVGVSGPGTTLLAATV